MDELDNYLHGLYDPKVYWGRDGVEAQAVKGFEQTCVVIAQHIGMNRNEMLTIAFFQAVEVLKKQFKERSKTFSNGKAAHKSI